MLNFRPLTFHGSIEAAVRDACAGIQKLVSAHHGTSKGSSSSAKKQALHPAAASAGALSSAATGGTGFDEKKSGLLRVFLGYRVDTGNYFHTSHFSNQIFWIPCEFTCRTC